MSFLKKRMKSWLSQGSSVSRITRLAPPYKQALTWFNDKHKVNFTLSKLQLLFKDYDPPPKTNSNITHSIKFTIEFEQDNVIPFLDILLKRCPNNTFVTSIYRKKTFTGLYTKWDSFTPRKYKINLIRTLTYRCYRICSSASLLQSALHDLRMLSL